MGNRVIFREGKPRCPVCGSHKFDATFELIEAGNWKLESIYCLECEREIEVTEELEIYLRGEKWTVKQEV